MAAARTFCDPSEIRQVCMSADWVHLKLLLYAIGSGNVGADNRRDIEKQWAAHMQCFGAALGAIPARLYYRIDRGMAQSRPTGLHLFLGPLQVRR